MTKVSLTSKIIIDGDISAPRHGEDVIYGLNSRDKIFFSEKGTYYKKLPQLVK